MELMLNVLGGFEMAVAGRSVSTHMDQRSRELTAFLLTYPNTKHRRQKLANMFWPDSDERRCQKSLSTVLWRTREAIKDSKSKATSIFKTSAQGEIFISQEVKYFCDAYEIKKTKLALRDIKLENLSDNIFNNIKICRKLYSGPYMDGSYLDWILRERERIESDFIDLMMRLLLHYKTIHAYNDAISVAKEILDADELRELVHRELIRLYELTGQRPQAILQYKKCEEILACQLGIPPMPETTSIFNELTSA